MKVYGNSGKIFNNALTNRVSNSPQPAVEKNAPKQTKTENRLNIPEDYKLRAPLDKKEQVFFEKLYPKARKEIQRYMQNQSSAPVAKGQIVDIRG